MKQTRNISKYLMKSKRVVAVALILSLISSLFSTSSIVKAAGVEEGSVNKSTIYAKDLKIQVSLEASWGTGENISVEIENNSNTTINDWHIAFCSEFNIVNIWNSKVVADDNGLYVISNAEWNSSIKPNEKASFGFIISKNEESTNWLPQSFLIFDGVNVADYNVILDADADNDGLSNIEELCIFSNPHDAYSINGVQTDYEIYLQKANEMLGGSSSKARIGTKAAIKTAVKWAVKHMDDLVDMVGDIMGKDVAKKLAKHTGKVSNTLNKLLEYEDLALNTIQDQVRNTLTPVIGYTWATNVALGIKLVIEALMWIL